MRPVLASLLQDRPDVAEPRAATRYALLAVAHLAVTWWMVGMIWVVQVVQYPLFELVGEPYDRYHHAHVDRIGVLLALPWLAEGLLTIAVFLLAPTRRLRAVATVGGLAMAALLLVTTTVAAPANGDLLDGFDAGVHDSLLFWNGVRTALWSARGVVAVVLVVGALRLLRPDPAPADASL
jgi:hypothetical protein